MRLRYLTLKNYPPLNDIVLSFSAESPLQRKCAIHFVVGVNGSGKTHLLQALLETFLCLTRQQKPHFPVTLVYELGDGAKARTLIFDNSGGSRKPGWWQSEPDQELLPSSFQIEDWQSLIENVRDGSSEWEALIENGNWPGKKVGLPQTVLAYTTGAIEPWKNILQREPPATDIDIISQSLDYEINQERPANWSLHQEIAHLGQSGDEEEFVQIQQLKKIAAEHGISESEQEICKLITPLLLKFALLSVSLPLAMEELRKHETQEQQHTFYQEVSVASEQGKGLRWLFNQVGWIWPVCISFTVDFRPNEWTEMESHFKRPLLQALYGFASEVVREPEPSTKRRLFFDLKAKNDADFTGALSDEAMISQFGGTDIFEFVGDALLQMLGGRNGDPNDHFKRLLEFHQQDIIEDIQISLRSSSTEDILMFDELSDGEQVFLGRMALFQLMQGQDDALLLLDEPEVHFNDKWKREIVDIIDDVLQNTANDVMIATHSSITLTDVFNDEIILFEKDNGAAKVVPVKSTTFGADPSELMIRLFGVSDSIGARAVEWLDKQLDRDWSQADTNELNKLIKRVGPGFHRSELRAILRRLQKNAS
ncbi:MAG: AAA family ATPase [Desulforhopalus sp.]